MRNNKKKNKKKRKLSLCGVSYFGFGNNSAYFKFWERFRGPGF